MSNNDSCILNEWAVGVGFICRDLHHLIDETWTRSPFTLRPEAQTLVHNEPRSHVHVPLDRLRRTSDLIGGTATVYHFRFGDSTERLRIYLALPRRTAT